MAKGSKSKTPCGLPAGNGRGKGKPGVMVVVDAGKPKKGGKKS